MKKALVTGVTGQDGSYLVELLLKKGYVVYGVVRRASTFNTERIDHLLRDKHEKTNFFRVHADLSDFGSLQNAINEVEPDEIYHLGAQSHVRISFDMPEFTADVTGLSTLRLLEAVRHFEKIHSGKKIKFYQASSSEMFGASIPPQNEVASFQPQSPYGTAKVFAHHFLVNYREAYNLFACSGILFNHESPRRGGTFVTRKITRGVVAIHHGTADMLYLGNLDAKRDWGYAPEYVEAMWMMLQQPTPRDYVIGTGEAHTVREFVEKAFAHIGTEIVWQGKDLDEEGVDKKTGKVLVKIDPTYFRPTEVAYLLADFSRAKKILGWEPKTKFDDLVRIMMEVDLAGTGTR